MKCKKRRHRIQKIVLYCMPSLITKQLVKTNAGIDKRNVGKVTVGKDVYAFI